MTRHTQLHAEHVAAGAKMVTFSGWDMPLHYGSQLEEHFRVRRDVGVFDVSHMTILDLSGNGTRRFLRQLLANDVDRLKQPGKALYSCMLQEEGGVIDDLITYFLGGERYRIVVNSGTRDKDLAWVGKQASDFEVDVQVRDDLSMLAVQGPHARARVSSLLEGQAGTRVLELAPFMGTELDELFIARTGYTGEDGFEIMLPNEAVVRFWHALIEAAVHPIGLGARDTLRLEAGMNLYGADMDETISPLECGLDWTVAWEPAARDFIGRAALEHQKAAGSARRFVGLVLEERGVLRGHQPVFTEGGGVGEITSGTFSPTLGKSIALARIPAGTDEMCEVEIRGKRLKARVVVPPFVRHGKRCF